MSIAFRIGQSLGRLLDPLIGSRVRAHYAAAFGSCRGCGCASPLAGPALDGICEPCHAAEVLAAGLGGAGKGVA